MGANCLLMSLATPSEETAAPLIGTDGPGQVDLQRSSFSFFSWTRMHRLRRPVMFPAPRRHQEILSSRHSAAHISHPLSRQLFQAPNPLPTLSTCSLTACSKAIIKAPIPYDVACTMQFVLVSLTRRKTATMQFPLLSTTGMNTWFGSRVAIWRTLNKKAMFSMGVLAECSYRADEW
jgi:hypothetical protein